MKIIVTGSRNWIDPLPIHSALSVFGRTSRYRKDRMTVVHGAAKGADSIAHQWVRNMESRGYPVFVVPYPAQWDTLGRAAGMIRNKAMVDENLDADYVLAFPLGESRGTRGCVDYAKSRGLTVINLGDK